MLTLRFVRPALVVAASLAASLAAFSAAAQSFPAKPVRWVVPFPPGGATDVVVRLLNPKLTERLGQPVVVENVGGAGGDIGHSQVARGPADGYTMLYAVPALVTNPSFIKSAVDPELFAGVIQATSLTSVLVASNGFAPKTVSEIIVEVRAKPGTVSCATPGSLPTVGCALLQAYAGVPMILVNYKGNAPALQALMGGEINLMFDLGPTVVAPVKAGRVRAVATAFPKRGAQPFPELPAVAETIPNFDLTAWQGVVVKAGTPAEAVTRLNRDLAAAMDQEEVRQKLAATGVAVVGGSAQAFDQLIKRDHRRFAEALAKAGVKPE